jgi:hypothetical protein
LKESWFLGYKRDGFAIISNVKISDVDSVCEDLASLDFVEALQERDYGSLTAA